jgi:hypothetical protein
VASTVHISKSHSVQTVTLKNLKQNHEWVEIWLYLWLQQMLLVGTIAWFIKPIHVFLCLTVVTQKGFFYSFDVNMVEQYCEWLNPRILLMTKKRWNGNQKALCSSSFFCLLSHILTFSKKYCNQPVSLFQFLNYFNRFHYWRWNTVGAVKCDKVIQQMITKQRAFLSGNAK